MNWASGSLGTNYLFYYIYIYIIINSSLYELELLVVGFGSSFRITQTYCIISNDIKGLVLRPRPYFGSAPQVFIIHGLRYCHSTSIIIEVFLSFVLH